MQPRRILLELFDAGLRAVHGREAVARALREHGGPVTVMAIGKAAGSMALGAHDALGSAIDATLVITKDGYVDPELARLPRATLLQSAHPIPDERSLAAGAELERWVARLDEGSHPVFLISGGSSSLVESLGAGHTLADLRELNEQGLAAGLDIAALNARRASLSKLKNGGIARLLGDRRATALFISDVPGDDPAVIGSGLLGRHGESPDQILRIIVASVDVAVHRIVQAAQASGLVLDARSRRFDGTAEDVAHEFVDALRSTTADGLVWGGESTVRLPDRHGRGGRNSHLALTAARLLRPQDGLTILAAGTDGTDGPTEDAGALVDSGTLDRAELAGCDVERAFREFDSGTALECAEDLVHTGPTGTNVGDLLVGIKRLPRVL